MRHSEIDRNASLGVTPAMQTPCACKTAVGTADAITDQRRPRRKPAEPIWGEGGGIQGWGTLGGEGMVTGPKVSRILHSGLVKECDIVDRPALASHKPIVF